MHEGKSLHFLSSFCAGFIAVGVTNPVDVVKTRIMNQAVGDTAYSLTGCNAWQRVRCSGVCLRACLTVHQCFSHTVPAVGGRVHIAQVHRDGTGVSYRSPVHCFFTVATTEGTTTLVCCTNGVRVPLTPLCAPKFRTCSIGRHPSR